MATAIDSKRQMMIIEDYASSTMTVGQICKKYKVANQTVYNILYKHYGSPENVPSRSDRRAAMTEKATKLMEEKENETKKQQVEKKPAKKKINKKSTKTTNKRYSKREIKAKIEKKEMEQELNCEVLTVPYAIEEPEYNPVPISIEFAGDTIYDDKLCQLEESDNYYECWLCSGRHITGKEMEGIFSNSIPDHTINDFEKLKRIETDFINKHLEKDEDGKFTKTLVVYLTGLQSPLSTLIALSYEMNFNLHLMHYDGNGNYNRQIIRGTNEDEYIDMSSVFSKLDGQIYFYNTTGKEIIEITKLGVSVYCLMMADVNDKEMSISTNRKFIICKSFDDLFTVYPKFLKSMMEKSTKHWIYARTMKMSYGMLALDSVLAKSFNYRTNFSAKQQDGND